jgi:hypothetical protein
MSKDLKTLNLTRYKYAAGALNEFGTMLSGWLKQQGGSGALTT